MPHFTYTGLSDEQGDNLLRTHMAPLESDFGPHPHWGGFPKDAHGNPSLYYPHSDDNPQMLARKEKNRAEYRNTRKKEFIDGLKKQDAQIALYGIDFPKGKAVEIAERPQNKALIAKLRNLPCFEEGVPKAEPKREAPKPKVEDK